MSELYVPGENENHITLATNDTIHRMRMMRSFLNARLADTLSCWLVRTLNGWGW